MGDKTLEDLKNAFAGESQANRKYLAFASVADKEGKPGVALLFRAVAEAETAHAHNHFKLFGLKDTTIENLKEAITGENHEVTTMYPAMLEHAEEEGEAKAKRTFEWALAAEKIHEKMYIEALDAVAEGEDINVDKISVCGLCGHTVFGDPPDSCPVCNAAKKIFKILTR